MDMREVFEQYASQNGKWSRTIERNSSGDGYKLIQTHTDWSVW